MAGATLISSQAVTTILMSSGAGGSAASPGVWDSATAVTIAITGTPLAASAQTTASDTSPSSEATATGFDEHFEIQDDESHPLVEVPDTVKMADGMLMHGTTDHQGRTSRYETADTQTLEIFLGHI